jgi:hypothetical protein
MEMDGTNDAINGLLASWDLGPGSGLDIIGAERSGGGAKFGQSRRHSCRACPTTLNSAGSRSTVLFELQVHGETDVPATRIEIGIPESKRTADDGTNNLFLFDGISLTVEWEAAQLSRCSVQNGARLGPEIGCVACTS